ncbi:MAG TPA: hypothetical protein VK141_08635 [Nitrosomonas sp.]|nr:hypothetical protein [Nitrosomonas sp.]
MKFIITTDTIATIEIPRGFQSIIPQDGTTPIGKIFYSDSSFILYSVKPTFDRHLIMGPGIEQRDTYNWNK